MKCWQKKSASFLCVMVLMISLTISAASAAPVFAFEKTGYTLNTKGSLTLKPLLQGAQASKSAKYTWVSADETIATVTNGKVKGISTGSTEIACTITDGEALEMTAHCTVTILQPVTKITYNVKDLQIQVGTSMSFTPTVLPENASDKELRFSSSDDNIAKIIGKNTIKAVNRGKCTITAEATDGSGVKMKQPITVQTFVIDDLDEIVLSERKTYTITLPNLEHPYNSNAYYLRFSDDLFDLGHIYYDNTWGEIYGNWGDDEYLTINPKKAGKGTITLLDDNAYFGFGNPKAKHTITIIVEPSATYSEKIFPKMKYGGEYTPGELVSFSGVIMDVESDGYTIATKGKTDQPVKGILSGEAKSQLIIGEKVKVYGTYMEPIEVQTETGLTLATTQVLIEQINDTNYNPDIKKPEFHDVTDH